MSLVLREKHKNGVLLLTLNRPEQMNAYSIDLHHALFAAIDEGDKDPSVRVIVLTGAGRMFCAGADISNGFGGGGFGEDAPEIDGISRDYGGMLNLRIFECDTPLIAAINGHAVGIGATMLLPFDIKIASEKTKFAFPFGRRGIAFDGAASFFLPRIVGLAKAQEWILKGDTFMASEALSAGMISEVVAPGNVLPRALALAADIAQNVSPTSAANNKRLIRASILGDNSYGNGAMSAHMKESKILAEAFVSHDCQEGVKAFFEKRSPEFKDRNPDQ